LSSVYSRNVLVNHSRSHRCC